MKRILFFIVILALVFVNNTQAQTVQLSVPEDLSYGAGKTLPVPVILDNTVDVTAVDFEVEIPLELTGDSLFPARCGNHEYIVRGGYAYNGKYRYRVMIYSQENSLISGSSGELMTLSVKIPDDAVNGETYDVKLSRVIVSDLHGKNVATGSKNGLITVDVLPRPDLRPFDVKVAQTVCEPGGRLDFTWKVENVGNLATAAGWSEKIYLEDEDGNLMHVGTTAYEGTLAEANTVSREHSLTLSDYPGVSGSLRPRITIQPSADCGEIYLDQSNNSAYPNSYTLYVNKYLHMTAYSRLIPENSTRSYACEVRRTGSVSETQSFDVIHTDSAGNTGRLTISDGGKVLFKKGSNKAYFYVTPVDNNDVNVNEEVYLILNPNNNNGYPSLRDIVRIEEDDKLELTLSTDKIEYSEGESIKFTVKANRAYPGELPVYLNIEEPKRFKLPMKVTMPDGVQEASVEIPILQDNIPANDISVEITATAEHYDKANAVFILRDDDVPAISMTLTPTTVSESAGVSAIYGTLTRSGVTDNKITVKLSDDGNDDIYYSTQILTLPAGTTTVNFPVGIKNNSGKEGDRVVNIKASVYISDCDCDATGDKQASVEVPVTITDDDGEMLNIVSSKSTIVEGDEQGCVLTISRNTIPDTDLTVALSCDGVDLDYPATVTIPAGEKSVDVTLKALSNTTEEGDRTVSIVASCDGYSMGSCWVLVSDRSLPDLVFEKISLSKTACAADELLKMAVRVKNIGAVSAGAGVPIVIKANEKVITQYITQEPIGKDETKEMTIPLQALSVPGEYLVKAVINEDHRRGELMYVNNTSKEVALSVSSLYTFTIQSEKSVYKEGDTVRFTGKLVAAGSAGVGDIQVEPYVMYYGLRIAMEALTREQGVFDCEYVIPQGYRGEFQYGICNPGENRTDATQGFSVYGFERSSDSRLKHEVYLNEPYSDVITLRNLTDLPLTGFKAEITGATDRYNLELVLPEVIDGSQTDAKLHYTLTPLKESKGNNWETVNVHLSTNEGATLDLIFYNYTRVHTPNLVAGVTNINTTVTKGVARTYPIVLTNTGMGETGKVSISLPSNIGSFLSLVTPSEIPSLNTNDSTTVILRFNPGDDLDVNVVQKGNIAINSENGNGIPVYFNVKVVSEEKGALTVKVRDENTIYGNKDGEHPYVDGATVELRDYNTGALVRTMTTGKEGSVLMEDVNEGYYQLYVTAPKHDSYRQNIVISPGETTEHLATISYQAISVSWDVVETEVEDEYDIVSTLVYETQVPVPVIRMTMPDSLNLDLIEYGRSTLFNIVLRNEGLITAYNIEVSLFEVDGYTVTPMVPIEGLELAPESSMVIPVRVTRNEAPSEQAKANKARSSGSCGGRAGVKWEWLCGEDSKFGVITKALNYYSPRLLRCGSTGGRGKKGDFDIAYGPGGGGYPTGIPWEPDYELANAVTKLLCLVIECSPIDIPFGDCIRTTISVAEKNSIGVGDAIGCGGSFVKKVSVVGTAVSCVEALIKLKDGVAPNRATTESGEALSGVLTTSDSSSQQLSASMMAWYNKAKIYLDYCSAIERAFDEKLGCPALVDTMDTQVLEAIALVEGELYDLYESGKLYDIDINTIPDDYSVYEQAVADGMADAWMPAEGKVSVAYLTALMPGGIANWYDFRLKSYVERIMNSYRIMEDKEPVGDNYPKDAILETIGDDIDNVQGKVVEMGYVSLEELLESANNDRLDYYEEQSGNTCATVKLEIEQKLVMTRQAFRGTLTVDNAMSTELKDIELNVIVSNMQGEQATNREMQISFESIEGFKGSDEGPWTLAPNSKGVATILFIPTKYAAPDTLTTYSFGGNLYFREADSEEIMVRNLYPVKLQVKPAPELDLTYFMQRDIYGDNPLTKDVVEPIVPAEFSVMIRNNGNGDATNVRMLTKQPEIVENEKGLLIDFAIVSSSLNGKDVALALDSTIATDFGNILAGNSAYATWNMTSTLLGHFIDYKVEANHVTSYGNPNLSLLGEVTIHELIHSVDVAFGDSVHHAWLTNDEPDSKDMPDHLYFLDGTTYEVTNVSDRASIEPMDSNVYKLSVSVPQKGFYYACVADPTQSLADIVAVKESGNSIDPDCLWQTRYTIKDNTDPLRDNRLHIVFYADAPKTATYEVEFEPVPDVRLAVVCVETLPDENEIAESVIEKLTVSFNKGVKAETFTREDITVRCEGKEIATPIAITQVADSVFDLNTSALSGNGYYTLQVRAENILDSEGYEGYEGRIVRWMLYKDGLVHYSVAPWPSEEAGEVSVSSASESSGAVEYGNEVEMSAEPAYGYEFAYWGIPAEETGAARSVMRRAKGYNVGSLSESDIEKYSTDNPLCVPMNKDFNLCAVFKPKKMRVNFIYDAEGGTVSIGSGLYDFGSVLKFKISANDGYVLKGFVINDGEKQDGDSGEVLVDRDEVNVVVDFESTSAKNILLQETKDYVPSEVPLANVKLQRSFLKGLWNTICLPCAVDNVTDVFGRGTVVARLSGMENNVVEFSTVDEMLPNIPYIIKVGSIENSSIKVGETKSSFYDIVQTSVEIPEDGIPVDAYSGVEFIGSYNAYDVPAGQDYYYINDEALWNIDGSIVLPAGRFSGYFRVLDHTDGAVPYAIDGNLVSGFELSVPDTGYSGLYIDRAVVIPPETEVYIAISVDGGWIKMQRVTGVLPANTGIIVKAEPGTYPFIYTTENHDAIDRNLLFGTVVDEYITPADGTICYVLCAIDGSPGMCRANLNSEGKFLNKANEVYMPLDVDRQSDCYYFDFDGTTAIYEVTISDGVENAVYDLQGRKIDKPDKGIYIINGKKRIIR